MKELETTLPTITHVNAYQIKDYLQALVDDGSIHMDKIGSGHWYWSFFSGMRKDREDRLHAARVERYEALVMLMRLREHIQEVSGVEERHQPGARQDQVDFHRERKSLLRENAVLRAELAKYTSPSLEEKTRIQQSTLASRMWNQRWEQNIFLVEQRVLAGFVMSGQGNWAMDAFRQSVYGDEYRPEEGSAEGNGGMNNDQSIVGQYSQGSEL